MASTLRSCRPRACGRRCHRGARPVGAARLRTARRLIAPRTTTPSVPPPHDRAARKNALCLGSRATSDVFRMLRDVDDRARHCFNNGVHFACQLKMVSKAGRR